MQTVRIGHSPDPDDAFMFYALTAGKVTVPGVRVEHLLEDIESLNRRARSAELEVTAVSFATYLLVADRYRMMDAGASMGKGYGPILVARQPVPAEELEQRVVAIPGKHTTAALLLRLYVGDPPVIEHPPGWRAAPAGRAMRGIAPGCARERPRPRGAGRSRTARTRPHRGAP